MCGCLKGPEDSSPDVPEGDESDEEQSGATARRRKRRRNILPRIARGQRCGECHTCRNPQMKKACVTMRAKLMQVSNHLFVFYFLIHHVDAAVCVVHLLKGDQSSMTHQLRTG